MQGDENGKRRAEEESKEGDGRAHGNHLFISEVDYIIVVRKALRAQRDRYGDQENAKSAKGERGWGRKEERGSDE